MTLTWWLVTSGNASIGVSLYAPKPSMRTPATNAITANRRDTPRSISCFSMASQQLFGFAVDEQRAFDDDLIARVQPGLDLHFAVDRAADADLARGELVVARLDVDDVRLAVL